jgi:phospholipid/cholesterol/gamma-HCH transport system ATP-binding protein
LGADPDPPVCRRSFPLSDPVIRLADVHKYFGDNHALKGITLDILRGESLVLIGPSASGKTLLLKTVMGLVHPEQGSILVDGEETVGLSDTDRMRLLNRFGVLFQRSALFDSLTVWENVCFRLLRQKTMSRSQARDLAIVKLGAVGLAPDDADLLPSELSGGMQKRVGIARAIAADPEIVFLDEPTAGLDPIMSNVINDLILRNVRDLGATAVTINSDMVGAKQVADRIAMLHEGRLVWLGPADQADNSGNAYLDQFIHQRAEGPIETVVAV